jgi:hypothetical protein
MARRRQKVCSSPTVVPVPPRVRLCLISAPVAYQEGLKCVYSTAICSSFTTGSLIIGWMIVLLPKRMISRVSLLFQMHSIESPLVMDSINAVTGSHDTPGDHQSAGLQLIPTQMEDPVFWLRVLSW